MNTRDRDDLLFLYAADALEGEEREAIESWLASGDPAARDALARAEHDLARLAAAQTLAAPNPAVRERLLARVAGERATPGASHRATAQARWPALLAAGLAGVLAAGAVGLGFWRDTESRRAILEAEVASSSADAEGARAERDELDAELAENEARLRSLESDLVLAEKAIGVLSAEHAESVALAGTAEAPDARGRVFWDWDAWYCYARMSGLPEREDAVYAMWLFTEDDVIGVGTFHAGAEGRAVFLSPVPHDVGVVLRAAVSIEPDEDLGAKPRGAVLMIGEVDPANAG